MKRHLVLIAMFFLSAQILPACAPTHTIVDDKPPKDYVALIADLTAAGAVVETDGEVKDILFSGESHAILVNGGKIWVYEYRSPLGASIDARSVSHDGSAVGTTQVHWIAKPHFYNIGKLIVLYLGESAAINDLLESIAGPQFAGR